VFQPASLRDSGTFYPDPLLALFLDFLQVVQRTLGTLLGKRIIRLLYFRQWPAIVRTPLSQSSFA
jgi:hypothetical protein